MNRQGAKNAKEEDMSSRVEPNERVDSLAHAVIGAAIEVHRALGPGYLESVYEQALAVELKLRGIDFVQQHPVSVEYKGHDVGQARLDLFIANELVVELKAVDSLAPVHTAQVLSYLKTTGCRLGLLINFNMVVLRDGIKRVVLS